VLSIGLATQVWVAGPIMGLCWQLHGRSPHVGAMRLRVMTYNIKYYKTQNDEQDLKAIWTQIAAANPDILLLQDATNSEHGPLGELLRGWSICVFGQYVIASRLPLSNAQVGSISFFGQSHTYLRCQLRAGSRLIDVYNVHLLTPRFGLVSIKNFEGISDLQTETSDRLVQAHELAKDLKADTLPAIVAGDFNAPLQSIVCQTIMQDKKQDAFAAAGRGYGYTYGHSLRFRHSFVRIDHIFADSTLSVIDCWAGKADGSDHRPVIADIALPQ
jgi:endonuclease/exonuclease/phosphatase (EEP) superfamily protein YafD